MPALHTSDTCIYVTINLCNQSFHVMHKNFRHFGNARAGTSRRRICQVRRRSSAVQEEEVPSQRTSIKNVIVSYYFRPGLGEEIEEKRTILDWELLKDSSSK